MPLNYLCYISIEAEGNTPEEAAAEAERMLRDPECRGWVVVCQQRDSDEPATQIDNAGEIEAQAVPRLVEDRTGYDAAFERLHTELLVAYGHLEHRDGLKDRIDLVTRDERRMMKEAIEAANDYREQLLTGPRVIIRVDGGCVDTVKSSMPLDVAVLYEDVSDLDEEQIRDELQGEFDNLEFTAM